MAVLNLVEQHLIFISNTGSFDENAIRADSLIQSFAANSEGGDIIAGYDSYYNWSGSVWTFNNFYELVGFITPLFQVTVQQNIPTLQQHFPQYTIVTWGTTIAFGN